MLVLLLALLAALAAVGANAKPRKRPAPTALLEGTVFNPDGFLVRGADVVVENPATHKRWELQTDEMGIFDAHLPPGAAHYTITVKARGYLPTQSTIDFVAAETRTLFLHLERAGQPAATAKTPASATASH